MKDDDDDKIKFVVVARGAEDEERAARLTKYVNWVYQQPIGEENFFQFLATLWLLASSADRMLRRLLYGNNPPN